MLLSPYRMFGGGNRRIGAADALSLYLYLLPSLLLAGCGGGPPPGRDRPVTPAPAASSAPAEAAPAAAAGGLAQVAGRARPAVGMLVSIVLLDPHAEIEVPLPDETLIMDQIGRQFVPGFILARAGQTIDFTNSEDELHTVHVKDSHGESIFNIATMMGTTYEHTFQIADEYGVICNTHTEMFADIMVVDTPYAVVADRAGRFSVPDVIPGRYTAVVIHGRDRSEHEIEIAAGENEIDLTGA